MERKKNDPMTKRFGRTGYLLAAMSLALPLFVGPLTAPAADASPWSRAGWDDATNYNYNPKSSSGSLYWIVHALKANVYWDAGFTGEGVDVALIDTGVVPVNGLSYLGKVINGPDLSFESQSDKFRHLDTYGHGTHMAAIIAGRDDAATVIDSKDYSNFKGVAPGARIVSVKVADREGSVDVSQIIAAIDWVVQNRNKNGLNIRVLNLSFGTDSSQSYLLDPVAFAVERAWMAGIVVVAAAGNDGNDRPLRNPAKDPYVIAVGSAEGSNNTYGAVSDFSNCGVGRTVDLVAPGKSIVSLRNPGSSADVNFSSATVAERYFLGSGTSQAAAVVSGVAALIVQQRPNITPDQVKELLTSTASRILRTNTGRPDPCEGSGMPNLLSAFSSNVKNKGQKHVPSVGLGSLELARGSSHLVNGGITLEGEQDIFGVVWDPVNWAIASALGTSWSGGTWNGTSWSGDGWTGTSWSGTSWSGTSWSGTSWSGTSWSGTSWSDQTWSGTSWSGTSWSGTSWSGTSWSDHGWLTRHARGQSWG